MNTLILEKVRPVIEMAVKMNSLTQEEFDELYNSAGISQVDPFQLYSPVQVAKLLNVSRGTIWNMIKRGTFAPIYICDMPRIPAFQVQELIESANKAS